MRQVNFGEAGIALGSKNRPSADAYQTWRVRLGVAGQGDDEPEWPALEDMAMAVENTGGFSEF